MLMADKDLSFCFNLPYMDLFIVGARSKTQCFIRCPCYHCYSIQMFIMYVDLYCFVRFPDMYHLIGAGRGNILTVIRPGERIYPLYMVWIGGNRLVIRYFPNLDCLIAARSNTSTIRCPCDGIYHTFMMRIGK